MLATKSKTLITLFIGRPLNETSFFSEMVSPLFQRQELKRYFLLNNNIAEQGEVKSF